MAIYGRYIDDRMATKGLEPQTCHPLPAREICSEAQSEAG